MCSNSCPEDLSLALALRGWALPPVRSGGQRYYIGDLPLKEKGGTRAPLTIRLQSAVMVVVVIVMMTAVMIVVVVMVMIVVMIVPMIMDVWPERPRS